MGLYEAIFGGGDEGYAAARKANAQNRALLDKIQLPTYNTWEPSLFTNEDANYELISEDPMTRSAQLSALAKMSGLAEEGLSDADQAEFTRAVNDANQLAKSRSDAVMNNAIARGMGGSGLEFLLKEQGNQDAAQRAQNAGLETAATAAKQKALYNQMFLQGMSGVRDQDYKTNSANSNIINQFNLANTNARNQTNNNNTALHNDAFKYNQGLKDKNFNNQMSKATGQMNLNNKDADISMAQSASESGNRNALLNTGLQLGTMYAMGGFGGGANKATTGFTGATAGEPYNWEAYA